ncbi:uncharacterized protein [Mytilus edulis]|uniref:uncharacterized protein n=1 Tax=Mytilus edulis TaxID=6550 RepID=UPI0039F0870A
MENANPSQLTVVSLDLDLKLIHRGNAVAGQSVVHHVSCPVEICRIYQKRQSIFLTCILKGDAACTYEYGGNCVLESECNMIRNSRLCTSCDGLICCIPTPVTTSQWIGTYNEDGKDIAFGFTLTFDGISITGQDSEGNEDITLDGTMVAFSDFVRIEFTTTSTLAGTEVGYSGFLINDGQTISGRWGSGQKNGAFVLNRVQ